MKIALLLSLIVTFLFCGQCFAQYGGGNGSAGNPWQITTPAHLQALMGAAGAGHWSNPTLNNFILTDSIDMTGIIPTPIGNAGTKFTGTFDGGNHIISNVTIDAGPAGDRIGLFGWIGAGGTIQNLGVVNCDIIAKQITGGLCGENEGGTINKCYTTGTVTISYEWGGGLCGYNNGGDITNSHSTCTVSALNNNVGGIPLQPPNEVGGFVGVNENNGTITNCYATGDVTAQGQDNGGTNFYGKVVGGFCGTNGDYDTDNPGTITNCYATGNVYAHVNKAGGFVAVNNHDSHIRGCYATGAVRAAGNDLGAFAGGFVAIAEVKTPATMVGGTITKCYATGNATADIGSYAGGFVGRNQEKSEIRECWASGNATTGGNCAGGFAGGNTAHDGHQGVIIDCYSTGSAHADANWAGGFFGWSDSVFTNCYSLGAATSPGAAVGGFGGESDGAAFTCNFWDTQASGLNNDLGVGGPDAGIQGKTTAEIRQRATFNCGWNFNTIWGIVDSTTYPFLRASTPNQPAPVPTLNEWGRIVFFLILAGLAVRVIRQAKVGVIGDMG